MYVWESYEVQYLANDASKLQTFDEKSVKMLIVWHRRESDIPVIYANEVQYLGPKCN